MRSRFLKENNETVLGFPTCFFLISRPYVLCVVIPVLSEIKAL